MDSWVRNIHWRRDRLPTPILLGFPDGSSDKESACNAGDLGREDPLEKGRVTPLQYYDLENSMDCVVREVTKSQTRLSDFHFQFPIANVTSY